MNYEKGIEINMKTLIICTIIIFLIIFLGVYPRYKKMRKEKEHSAVAEFRNNYTERRKEMQRHRDALTSTTNYITKYNSSEDYREK